MQSALVKVAGEELDTSSLMKYLTLYNFVYDVIFLEISFNPYLRNNCLCARHH